MKSVAEKRIGRAGFTIVELLTVMSIIIILIGLLVPSLNTVKRYARKVRQKAQFHSIEVALDLWSTQFEGYPPSDRLDPTNAPYCGAMKLCEAMMGQDLLGFHPDSLFREDGEDMNNNELYPDQATTPPPKYRENLKARKGPYLQLENANAYRLENVYRNTGPFTGEEFVLCDVYTRVNHQKTGKNIGMPVLYYKADTSKIDHDPNRPNDPDNIYDYMDNDDLVRLGLPFDNTGALAHPMASGGGMTSAGGAPDPAIFYEMTKNETITTADRPYRADSYILLSAGFDGEYGTSDDVFNFGD